VQAIARAVGLPATDVQAQLAKAQASGQLAVLPLADWTAPPRERLRINAENKHSLELAARRLFKISPVQANILMLLLQYPEVQRERINETFSSADSNTVSVQVFRLRQRLEEFGCVINTVYGYGYAISVSDQRLILEALFPITVIAQVF
jgi:DNA-binding response OmpR family regulator